MRFLELFLESRRPGKMRLAHYRKGEDTNLSDPTKFLLFSSLNMMKSHSSIGCRKFTLVVSWLILQPIQVNMGSSSGDHSGILKHKPGLGTELRIWGET